jgi:hypothetical protein
MNVFQEFYQILKHLQAERIDYALIGGVAVAFHTEPRFTRDIDILIRQNDLEGVSKILKDEGYFQSASPWTFRDSKTTLFRFLKVRNTDQMIIDIMVAGDDRHERIITDALQAEAEGKRIVKVANKADLIWLKKQRNSKQDQADIARLSYEES